MVVRDYGAEPMEIDDNEIMNDFADLKDELEGTQEIINDCRLEVDFLTACESRIRRGDRTTTFSPHFKFIHNKAPSTLRWYKKKMNDKRLRLLNNMRTEIDKFHTKYNNNELYADLLEFYIKCI
jgi:hypothetical protein